MGFLAKFAKRRREERLKKDMEQKKRVLNIKQNEIKKIEEEIDKMVKLELKNGRIQRVEEGVAEEGANSNLPPLPPLPPLPEVPTDMPTTSTNRQPTQAEFEAEELVNRRTEEMLRQRTAQQIYEQKLAQEAFEQQASQRYAQQQAFEQQRAVQFAQQQAMQQQAMQQQAMQQQAMQQPMVSDVVTVHILMTEGREAKEEIHRVELQLIEQELNDAIASCSPVQFGSRVLNGRYILEYMSY